MNSSTLRRLASDHSSLHTSPLPPHYLFPPSTGIPDDLTQLTILLTGPQGTPYSQGLWKLHLKIPEDYPKSPPKAAFKTRIWHPNVEEVSGSVCVDTLKRDWESKLTLRDVLITISCLLIQPNPDSALNSTAGHLLQEDYEAFSRQARLMTSIHARIPPELKEAVEAARHRGDVIERREICEARPSMPRKPASTSGVIMKKPLHLTIAQADSFSRSTSAPVSRPQIVDESSDNEIENDENDPSLSPSPVTIPTASPRRPSSAKRPLSDLPTPVEPESDDDDDNQGQHLSPSEKNIAANTPFFPPSTSTSSTHSEQQEGFKLTERRRSVNFSNPRSQPDNSTPTVRPFQDTEDADDADRPKKRICSGEGKENFGEAATSPPLTAEPSRAVPLSSNVMPPKTVGGVAGPRKASAAAKAKARVGLRRL